MPKKRLTDRAVAAAKGRQGKYVELWDAVTPGLLLIISPKGKKSWAVRYRRKSDKRKRKLTIGSYPALSLRSARDEALQALVEVRKGRDPQADKMRRAQAETFDELADKYMRRHAKREKRSWRKDQSIISRDISPVIGGMKLWTIQRKDIAEIVDRVEERGAFVQANRVFEVVRGIFRWGLDKGHTDHDPSHGLKARNKENKRDRVLSDDELMWLWQDLDLVDERRRKNKDDTRKSSMSWQTAQALKLCLLTAARESDIAGIRLDELDLSNPVWSVSDAEFECATAGGRAQFEVAAVCTISAERAKNKRQNPLYLSVPSIRIIRQVKNHRQNGYLFPSRSKFGHLRGDTLSQAWARSKRALGMEDTTCHDLRRTTRTRLAMLGIPDAVAHRFLNHVSAYASGVSGHYNHHQYRDELIRAANLWAEHLLNLAGVIRADANILRYQEKGCGSAGLISTVAERRVGPRAV